MAHRTGESQTLVSHQLVEAPHEIPPEVDSYNKVAAESVVQQVANVFWFYYISGTLPHTFLVFTHYRLFCKFSPFEIHILASLYSKTQLDRTCPWYVWLKFYVNCVLIPLHINFTNIFLIFVWVLSVTSILSIANFIHLVKKSF